MKTRATQEIKATHEGQMNIGEKSLRVAVLSNGDRIITQTTVFAAFGRKSMSKAKYSSGLINMPYFINAHNLQPAISNNLKAMLKPINYKALNGTTYTGYNAEILPEMCKMYLDARENGVLHSGQMHLARASEMLLISLSKLGMIALVDEATGYQYMREASELQKILATYVSTEIAKWQLTFKSDFYQEVFRLWGLPFNAQSIKRKPSFIGTLTNKYIYKPLPNGVLEAIKENTPRTENGNYKHNLHQSLTPDVGREHLKTQIIEVTALMSVCETKDEFKKVFDRKYGEKVEALGVVEDNYRVARGGQLSLVFDEGVGVG